MKRLLCYLLIIASLLCLCGCGSAEISEPANFYYIHNGFAYGSEDGVMASEVRSIAGFSREQDILSNYLEGPQDTSNLVSPFPNGLEITEFIYKEKILHITLSTHITKLSKAKQTLACACIARTAMELTGVSAVYFQTDGTTFTKMDPILIDKNSVLLYDDYQALSPTTTD